VNILGLSNAATGPNGVLGTLVSNSNSIQTQLSHLTEQSSTGLVSQTFGGLGDGAAIALNLSPQLGEVSAYSQNITTANTNLNLTAQVLSQVETIASTFYSGTLGLSSNGSQAVDTLASQAKTALGQLQGLLNTQNGENYLFAGEDTANAPVPDASFNAYIASIQTAASGLATNGAAATEAATLTVATSGSPFSTTLGTVPPSVPIGFGKTVGSGVVAGTNAYAPATTTLSTGSYVKDLIRSLATVASLSSSQISLGSSFSTLVNDTHTDLGQEIDAINNESAGVGAAQQELTADQTSLTDTQQAITTQISSVENVDAASVATALTQAQNQLQISYKLISSMEGLSLLQFLPTSP
jgi:flagellar hook-associated protein 3 FlgL